MKSPRDLLLEKHRAATPRLDALRRRILAETVRARGGEAAIGACAAWLRELLWPSPRAWAGLAAAWAVAFALNHAAQPDPRPGPATPGPAPAVFSSLLRQQPELHAWLDWPATPTPTPPRRDAPKPQSRRSPLNANA